jgi:uncharacterized delta-60 repeat protein
VNVPSGIAHAVVLQADGKIVATGMSAGVFGVARYTPDGSLDRGFGTGGKVLTHFGSIDDSASALGIAIHPDGKIVAAGTTEPYAPKPVAFALARKRRPGTSI